MGMLFKRKTNAQPTPAAVPDPQEVARVAYELYEQRGRADGRDFDDWVEAETIVRRRVVRKRRFVCRL